MVVSQLAVVELSVRPKRSVSMKYIDCDRQSAADAAMAELNKLASAAILPREGILNSW